jgi:nucleotide-binding universal stress UspA family protein
MAKQRIVVATDGSAPSRLAVEVGLRLARATGGDVVFVHSSPALAQELFEENPLTPDTTEHLAESDRVLAEALAQAEELGVEARLEVLGEHGARSVADSIVGAAAGLEATMIVLGSRGRGRVSEALLGSVSRGVAEVSHVPVVVVHAPAGEREE